ncbi:MAG: ACT domain-containing protein [Synechococcaceae cyanobacterium SM2_3_2]|nr:ACT domain-containing protein [Synechococcaceae cyanobacterium SM2_3_2]
MKVTSDIIILLSHIQPELNPGRYAFVSLPFGMEVDPAFVVASVRESEGLSVILPEQIALELGLSVAFTTAWITLTVHSDLAAVGLTAAFSQVLAQSGISCNVVAGVHHDHLFVPVAQAQEAMDLLHALQTSAAQQVV